MELPEPPEPPELPEPDELPESEDLESDCATAAQMSATSSVNCSFMETKCGGGGGLYRLINKSHPIQVLHLNSATHLDYLQLISQTLAARTIKSRIVAKTCKLFLHSCTYHVAVVNDAVKRGLTCKLRIKV